MDERKLYERQYGEQRLVSEVSFPWLRHLVAGQNLNREHIAYAMLNGGGGRVLDIGCGDGSMLRRLADNYSELYGVELVHSRLREARQKLQPLGGRAVLAQCNLNLSLPFPADAFDAVTCLSVLEHLFEPYSVMAEIRRVLKPGGTLVLEVPNIAYVKYRLQLLVGRLPVTSSPYRWEEIGWDGGHLHYFTRGRLEELFRFSGFAVERVSGAGLLAGLRNWWPSLLTGDLCLRARKR